MHSVARFYVLIITIVIVTNARLSFADEGHRFTVKNSIEMTTFSDPYTRQPDAECQGSPDGKHFIVVTTRGILRTNQLQSTLWDFSADEVGSYLRESTALAPKPHVLLTIIGTPKAQQDDSYGSLITETKWSADSKAILFLGEQPDGNRHLYRIRLSDAKSTDLTPGNVDIVEFGEAGGTIAYIVAEHAEPPKIIGAPINEASFDLTGISLFHILFPKTFPDASSFRPALDLWVRYRGNNRKVNAGGNWYFPTAATGLRVAVSPNGKAVIAARPVPEIPTGWLRYKAAGGTYNFSPASTGKDRSGKQFTWPWQYVHIDLDNMTVAPLVDAPSGFILGYNDALKAVWSQDGTAVLFTNSYLPLQDASGNSNPENEVACAAAVYSVADRSYSCLAYARYPKEFEWVDAVTFGPSTDEVRLEWKGKRNGSTEIYKKELGEWSFVSETAAQEMPRLELKIFIRQDMNVPPALWAYGLKTGRIKELWNPNPQLTSCDLGQASVYPWKDGTGYGWRGGLVLPPNFAKGNRYPLVIQTHGFSNEHEFLVDGSFTTGFAARPLAAAGIIVLQMGGRSDRHSSSPRDEARLQVLGFKSAIDQLNQDGLIDPSRVGIIGFSRTAWYTEEALVLEPHLFHAATIIDGVDQSYLSYMLFAPDNPWGAVDEEAANGGKPVGTGLERWFKNAAGFNLDKVQAPVRIEALGEISVLAEWEIYSSLRQQGKPVDLVDLPNAQHILQQPQERYASQQGNVDWFRYWLQGYRDPDPSKKEQYARWQKLITNRETF